MRHVDIVVHQWSAGYTEWLATLATDHQGLLEFLRDKYADGSHIDSTEIHDADDCPFKDTDRLPMKVTYP